jgi:GH43 family beta-xylosidase
LTLLGGLLTGPTVAARAASPAPAISSTFVSIKAYDLTQGYVRRAYGTGRVDDITASSSIGDRADATWALVPGLAGSCVSLESRNYRGYYLRHAYGDVHLQPYQDSWQFKQDATFCQVSGLADGTAFSLRAFQFPNAYLRHAYGVLHLADNDGSTLFKRDATFLTTPPWLTGAFFNPVLGSGQDPSMVYVNGSYYLAQGDVPNDDNIVIRRSTSVEHLEDVAPAVVWRHPACPAPACHGVWAPELQHIGAQWWIFFAGEDGTGNASHRMYALSSTGDDPAGPYEYRGRLALPDNDWAIDGTYLDYQGQHYFVWSGNLNGDTTAQHLFLARMRDPLTAVGSKVLISSPTADWETVHDGSGVRIDEAPQPVLGPNGRLSLSFSANGSWTNDYCLGLLTLDGTVTDPEAWHKSSGCVFAGRDTATSPGHNGFLTVNDKPELVYHAMTTPGTGWPGRSIRMQPLSFDTGGVPVFGTPAGVHDPVPLP